MICKGLVILAVVVQINAFRYNQEPTTSAKFGSVSARNFYDQGSSTHNERTPYSSERKPETTSSSQKSQSLPPIVRNIVVKGKYPVSLTGSGLTPEKRIPIQTSHIRAPVQERPIVKLPSKIPAPRTISHTCTCYKTIMKPKIQQTLITVPSIQRYIQTAHRPVIENIHYEAFPIKFEEEEEGQTQSQGQQESEKTSAPGTQQTTAASSPVSTQLFALPQSNTERDNFKASQVETFEIPTIRFVEASKAEIPQVQVCVSQKLQELPRIENHQYQNVETQKPQTLELSRYHLLEAQKFQPVEAARQAPVEVPKPRTIEIPRLQFQETQKSSSVQLPCLQLVESQKPLSIELPPIHFAEIPKHQTLEISQVQFQEVPKPQSSERFAEVQKVQKVEIPRFQYVDTSKPQTVEVPCVQFVESGKSINSESQREGSSKNSFSQQPTALNFGSEPFCFAFNQQTSS